MTNYTALLGSAWMILAGPAIAADIVIGVPNWPSVNATAHILKVAIEQNMGLEVELQEAGNRAVFEGMDAGTMHIHPEVWLPNQQNLHDMYVKEKGTVVMNPHGAEAFQAMCVDQATADEHGITSIHDLTKPEIAAIFDSDGNGKGEIWIGATGWASTNIEKIRAKSYGYDKTFDLVEMDETAAYVELDEAIKAGKPWVGFCQTPNYVFILHDLQLLEEPPYESDQWKIIMPADDPNWLEESYAPVSWNTVYLHIHYAKSLEETQPDVAKMLSNIRFDTDTVSAMTYALIVDGIEPQTYAEQWVSEHENTVLGWLSD